MQTSTRSKLRPLSIRATRVSLAVITAVAATIFSVPAATARSSAPSPDSIGKFDKFVGDRGSLGTYYDQATQQVVALLDPSDDPSSLSTKSNDTTAFAASLGLPARVKISSIDQKTVTQILDALVGLEGSIDGRYAFFFEPATETVLLFSSAPVGEFGSVIAKFGSHVRYTGWSLDLYSRTSDSPPHWGASNLAWKASNGIWTGCTAGFEVLYKGTPYFATAAHCFPQGTGYPLYNYFVRSDNSITGGGTYEGYVSWRPGTGNRPDVELIYGSSYQPRIYTSPTATEPVEGSTDLVQSSWGNCISMGYGGFEQSNCNLYDQQNSESYICDTEGYCSSGWGVLVCTSSCPVEGDSGAPSYLDEGTWAMITGMVAGGAGGNNGICSSTYPCYEYVTRWPTILAYFGVTMATA